MRRVAALLLVVGLLSLGSGSLDFAHELAHRLEEPPANAAAPSHDQRHDAHHHHHPHDHRHPHDEFTCHLYALLNAPLALTQAPKMLVGVGLLVGFLTLLFTPTERLRLPTRINCRGPPASLAPRPSPVGL